MGDKDDGIGTTTANVLGRTTASRSFVRHMFRRPRSHICPFHRPHKRTFIGPINETFCSVQAELKSIKTSAKTSLLLPRNSLSQLPCQFVPFLIPFFALIPMTGHT